MGLKERLFGPKWESKDPVKRREAVRKLRDRRLYQVLPDIAREDPDPEVRLAALERCADEALWLEARLTGDDDAIIAAADRFLLRACEKPAAGDLLTRRLDWAASIDSGEAVRRLARSAADAELRRVALFRISAQGFLGDCLITEPDEQLAAELIERIGQPSTLKRVADALRTRNKHRYQAVIRRLATIEQRSAGEPNAPDGLAASLVQQAEALLHRDWRGSLDEAIGLLERQWKELPAHDPVLARRFTGALAIARRALAESRDPVTVENDAPQVSEADTVLSGLTGEIRRLATTPNGDRTASRLAELRSRFDRRWNELSRRSEADHAARTEFDALVAELESRLQTRTAPDPGEPSATAPTGAEQRGDAHRNDQQIEACLARLQGALDGGDIDAAHLALSEARALLPGLRRPHRQKVDAQLGRAAARLKELRNWQHWANNELRRRLIEHVEAIDTGEMHPDAVLARLKELRERWMQLDAQERLPGDKRKHAAPASLWRRFQRACEGVYEQTRPALEQRDEVREQALQEVQQFIEEAERLAGQTDADQKSLIRHRRAAVAALRNLTTLPPKSRGHIAARLRKLLDALSSRIEERFAGIEAEKRRLVAEARKLTHERERDQAIARAKALQAEWKRIGPGRRRTDQQLWQEFREHLDPLFGDLKRERAEQRELEQATVDAITRLCEQAEALPDGDLETLAAATGTVAGLEEAFARHGRVPPALRKRFEQAVGRWRQRLEAAREAREQALEGGREQLAESLQQTWEARLEGRTPELPDVPEEGGEIIELLSSRLARLTQGDSDARALAEEVDRGTAEARQVVIELECLAGLESPEEDRQARMDYQVRRLAERLGERSGRTGLEQELAELDRRWFATLPHDPAQHPSLVARRNAARSILKKMVS
ncbi:MAG: hypothetical protein Kow0020_11950 [Wenzhouxiangellaceae bacterium]